MTTLKTKLSFHFPNKLLNIYLSNLFWKLHQNDREKHPLQKAIIIFLQLFLFHI
jgi:Fic family protein